MQYKVSRLGVTAVIIAILIVLWFTGIMGLWFKGIAYIAYNTKEFTDIKGHTIQDEYSISIDLGNLKSNIGKELYNDGRNRIYVSWIDNTGSIGSGGYRIGFRSCGTYSLNGASLISGARHATVDEKSYTTYMSAKMTAKYNGKTYNSSESGTSGLNYRDGDDFGFYIFPGEAYEKGEISLQEKGIAQLTVTNLYENIWVKR